ncbi:MAG: DUF2791 family P-loop domain-containing protein [Deltaproteobacteria bacterium]|nr:DUF2791 family P-loop domain-containing protein [Deltaproteobacteria bacterium]
MTKPQMTKPSKLQAKQILRRMGETGQPPERGARFVNVGTAELLEVLREEYLATIRESGRFSAFKLVQAPYGGGKTHFLHCLRELAWDEGFVTALVSVSPKECPFDDPVKIYQAVASRLESPPATPDEASDWGIDALLRAELARRTGSAPEPEVRAWLEDELSKARVDAHGLRRAAQLYMLAVLDRDARTQALLSSYLRGESVGLDELRDLGIRELLDSSSGFRFLRSLVQLLRALEVPGVVLLFDEMDRVMSLSRGRVRAIGDNLRQMIDHCGQASLPALLWVYAVPPEFMTTVVPQYPALDQRLKGAAALSAVNPMAPVIDLDRLPIGPTSLLVQLGERLLELHQIVHRGSLDRAIQLENLGQLARELGERQLESGTRRTFVKSAIQLLSEQQRGGQSLLNNQDVQRYAQGPTAPAPAPLAGESLIL